MKPHHYLAILIRLFSIVLFMFAIKQSNYLLLLLLDGHVSGLQPSILQMSISFLVPIGVSLILWFFPVLIARSILSSEMDQDIEAVNKQSIFSILIASIGLFFCFRSIVDASYFFSLWQLLGASEANAFEFFDRNQKANVWATGIELILALIFILKSKTLARKIFSLAS